MVDVIFFYRGIEPIIRILVVGTLTYIILLLLLRISGQRTLAQMKGFDFIVTIAIGSTFGRLLTATGVSLAESATALFLLIGLQYLVAWLTTKSSAFTKFATNEPVLLYFQGQFLRDRMKAQRVTQKELMGVVRQQGIGSLNKVEAIVMEASGKFAVVEKERSGDNSALDRLV